MMKTFSSEEAKQEEIVNNNDENVLILFRMVKEKDKVTDNGDKFHILLPRLQEEYNNKW